MKPETRIKVLLLAPLAAAICFTGMAQETTATIHAAPPPAQTAANAGLLNDWLRQESEIFNAWNFGGQVRGRFEAKNGFAVSGIAGSADFSTTTPDNNYWLWREKLHVGWKPAAWLNLFAEARDSSSIDDKRKPRLEEDALDLHQAFIHVGDVQKLPVTAKVGRQELIYGDERLVGAFDWNNLGRVFAAVKLRWENASLWLDMFSGRVVIPRDRTMNTVNDYDWFSGAYASTRSVIPRQETQLYFLARNVGPSSPAAFPATPPSLVPTAGPRGIYTAGLRCKSLLGQFGGWDYDAELAGQFGYFHDSKLAKNLDHEAFAAHVGGGYAWANTWGVPRLGMEYNFASGDSDPKDGKHGTFDNLFPTNHKFYGFMDFVSWQNIHNVRLASSIKPVQGLTLTADCHLFWLASTSDYFYSVAGAPRNAGGYGIKPANDNFAGAEADFTAVYVIKPCATAQLGYGHFFRGNYVKQSLAVSGSKDAGWFYAQLVFNL